MSTCAPKGTFKNWVLLFVIPKPQSPPPHPTHTHKHQRWVDALFSTSSRGEHCVEGKRTHSVGLMRTDSKAIPFMATHGTSHRQSEPSNTHQMVLVTRGGDGEGLGGGLRGGVLSPDLGGGYMVIHFATVHHAVHLTFVHTAICVLFLF